jgi:alkane 1-monooxygenase
MTTPAHAVDHEDPLSWAPVARRFIRYLLTLTIPVSALAFSLTGPHRWYWALLFWLILPLHQVLDGRAKPGRDTPVEGEPAWLYTGLLNVLALFHLANVVLVCRMVGMAQTQSWTATIELVVDVIVATMLVGTASGLSGIVVAHELMHRPQKVLQLLSRIVMGSVLYEHFFTEHIRGHHVRVGTVDDPATARFGETFFPFFRRTVPAQFRSAWEIEIKRNGLEGVPVWHPAQLRNRVMQGLIVEACLCVAVAWVFGAAALVMFLLQALWAIRLLESVNYFEHWGLSRTGRKVRPVDSWDTESSFTLYGMVGLSRHADHHAYASRPYQQLRPFEESPKYPGGYITMATMVITRNQEFIRIATEELHTRKLGPFAEATE